MATIMERTGKDGKTRFTVQIRIKGHKPQTATFDRVTDAKQWVQRTEGDLRRGRHLTDSEAKRHTLADVIDRYIATVLPRKAPSTASTQKTQLDYWKERIGHLSLAGITPAIISQERDVLANGKTFKSPKRSPSTVIRYMAVLSHLMNTAMKEWQLVEDNPVRKVAKPKEPRGRVRFLSDDERTALLSECKASKNPYLHDVVMVALCTGMRRGEIMHLTWDQVHFDRRNIVIENTKNGERRTIPIRGEIERLLTERAKIRRIDTPYIFPALYRANKQAKPIDLQGAWDSALERAKIENFKFHDLRHTAASYLTMQGATLAELAEVLGHKTLQMVKRYSHLSEQHTGDLLERLGKKVSK